MRGTDTFLSILHKHYANGDMSAEQVFQKIASMMVVSTAGMEQHNPKHAWLYDALDKATSGKLKTREKKYYIGNFIQFLIDKGAPRIHAVESTATWLNMSAAKIRQAHEHFRNENKERPELDFHREMKTHLLHHILDSNDKPFPADHPKAYAAFGQLKSEMTT